MKHGFNMCNMCMFNMLQDQNQGSKMKMLLSVVLLFSLFFSVTPCPENCFYEYYRAECHITECSDQLFTEVDLLVIFGSICDNHRYILTNIDSGTKILLKDSKCEDIPNCR